MSEFNEDEKWFQVSLRFMGESLPVDEIEGKLGIKPSSIGKMGEHIQNNPKYAKHYTNLWVWRYTEDVENTSVSFEHQISNLLDILEPKKHVLKELLAIPSVKGELFLGFSSGNGQGGAYFSPLLLARISALGLAFDLDLYPPNGIS